MYFFSLYLIWGEVYFNNILICRDPLHLFVYVVVTTHNASRKKIIYIYQLLN